MSQPLLRQKPKLSYCGLTVILSNPSRFDKVSLLNANGGVFFNSCLRPEFNVMQCDVRLADDKSPLLDGTKCLLLLGEYAMHQWCFMETKDNVLNEMRGSLLDHKGVPAIATFFPQDAVDIKNYESRLNEESKGYTRESDSSYDELDEGDVKRFSNTKRSNFAFWIRADIQKVKQILSNQSSRRIRNPTYRICPGADEVIARLREPKGQYLDFDIETDYEEQNLLCFSFSFDDTVFSVPVLNHEYKWAYSSLHFIMRALAVAIRDNILVCHNGAAFDFLVLGYKYHIPIGRVFDTMVAFHRCFPDIEQSLGHCMSYFTWEKFHKDTDSKSYRTQQNMMDKLRYCAKDVWGMKLVREGIQSLAKKIPGLSESIDCAMKSIRPYSIMSLQGIRYDPIKKQKLIHENDRLLMQYDRMIKLLVGDQGMLDVQSTIKGRHKSSMPNSNKQCVQYFHEMLGYPVVFRNPPDRNGIRQPSLAKGSMLKLRLKHENPVIDLCNAFRYTKLEVTTPLGFMPWKDDSGEIVYDNQETN